MKLSRDKQQQWPLCHIWWLRPGFASPKFRADFQIEERQVTKCPSNKQTFIIIQLAQIALISPAAYGSFVQGKHRGSLLSLCLMNYAVTIKLKSDEQQRVLQKQDPT